MSSLHLLLMILSFGRPLSQLLDFVQTVVFMGKGTVLVLRDCCYSYLLHLLRVKTLVCSYNLYTTPFLSYPSISFTTDFGEIDETQKNPNCVYRERERVREKERKNRKKKILFLSVFFSSGKKRTPSQILYTSDRIWFVSIVMDLVVVSLLGCVFSRILDGPPYIPFCMYHLSKRHTLGLCVIINNDSFYDW